MMFDNQFEVKLGWLAVDVADIPDELPFFGFPLYV